MLEPSLKLPRSFGYNRVIGLSSWEPHRLFRGCGHPAFCSSLSTSGFLVLLLKMLLLWTIPQTIFLQRLKSSDHHRSYLQNPYYWDTLFKTNTGQSGPQTALSPIWRLQHVSLGPIWGAPLKARHSVNFYCTLEDTPQRSTTALVVYIFSFNRNDPFIQPTALIPKVQS